MGLGFQPEPVSVWSIHVLVFFLGHGSMKVREPRSIRMRSNGDASKMQSRASKNKNHNHVGTRPLLGLPVIVCLLGVLHSE